MKRRDAREAGFTLIEILVVLVIIGLIAAVAVPQITRLLGSAKAKTARIQIQTVENGLNYFELDLGRYPTEAEGLAALMKAPTGADDWSGPYLKSDRQLIDPWGRPLIYKVPSTKGGGHGFVLETLGADGQQGGSGDDKDIVAGK